MDEKNFFHEYEIRTDLYEVKRIRDIGRQSVGIPQLHGGVLDREPIHETTPRVKPHTVRHTVHDLLRILLDR